ncbi:hypothetical protein [Aurantimonas sp. 22II-16-19i]|uniref:hypothetical protein n=1 Tax=Aurantimonas sp. 22II-16-19i TaxID=1317114 RepID=UPI00111C8302|nr:hypothetical protein [Aurantimonas sp. 22II-16-19i]
MRDRVDLLFTDTRLERVATPRHAAIFLVAGPMRHEDREDLRRLHDQLPHPRATLLWNAGVGEALGSADILGVDTPAADRLVRLWARLASGDRRSEPDLLKDVPPNPWQAIGPHGQGGKGMMGGTPYGRPMAMTADDWRDGLALDAYTARFGPFLPMFPPGLLLEMTLQGDVIQSVRVLRPPLMQEPGQDGPAAARLRLARLLDLLGLPALGQRTRLAAGDPPAPAFQGLKRAIRWSGAALAIPPGLGAIEGQDVRARLSDLLALVDGATAAPRPDLPASAHLSSLLPGLEWSEAMLLLNSFDDERLAALAVVKDEADEDGDGHEDTGHRHHDRSDRHGHGGHDHDVDHGGGP